MSNSPAREPVPPRVKPEVMNIETLFHEIEAGELRIPRFQRPFVWKPENMIALFDSIRLGYPIGSLLIWQTKEDVQSLGRIGPIEIPQLGDQPVAYILDGQQRLSTLYGVLRLDALHPKEPKQSDWQWWIYYDFEAKKFVHVSRGATPPKLLPLRALLRTTDFLKEAQRLKDEFKEEAQALIDQGQSLAQRIQAHQLTVIRIQGGTLAQAVEIFSRLNTTGQKMTPDQMTSALTYREGAGAFDLAGQIDRIVEGLDTFNFGNLSRTVIFRAILVAAGFNMHTTAWADLAKNLHDKLPDTVQKAKQAVFDAARFLNNELGVPGDQLLSYALQFVFLTEFFRRCPKPGASQIGTLRRWFWATSFSGWFAGVNPTQVRLALDEICDLADGRVTELKLMRLEDPCRPFPRTFDLHSARLRTFILFMIQRLKPRGLDGEALEAADLFFEQGSRAFAYMFRNAPDELVSRTANRVLLPVRRGHPARKQILEYLSPEDEDTVLASHGINQEAYAALVADDAAGFIAARERHLVQIEREFMSELGLTPPAEALGESDIDTGDD
jgi:hypothetical protein